MHTTLFYLFLAIFIAGYLLEQWLGYLNVSRAGSKLPALVSDIYDAEKYRQQQEYFKANYRFSLWSGGFNFVLVLAMLLLYGFALVNGWAELLSSHPVLRSLIFFGILLLAADLLNLPFSIYDTFVIEQKFGFNTTTPKTFILDKLKTLALGTILGGGILALIITIFYASGSWFWIIAWGVVTLFTLFIHLFYSTLIVPIFNRQTPLEEGELRQAIEDFSRKAGFKLKDIYILDSSKRSTKANAYFTGLGSRKRIVLFDTLVKEMTVEEVVAVLAHEIGHYRKHHVELGLVMSLLQTALMLFLFSLFAGSAILSEALGVSEPNFHIGMVAFAILYTPVSLVLGLAGNVISRKNEFQADRFAAEQYSAVAMASALKRLSAKNLSNLTPHPLYVFFNYSHPTLVQRLENLEKYRTNES